MPDPSDPAMGAPPPGDSAPGGAVAASNAGTMPQAQQPGMVPPSTSAQPQDVPASGVHVAGVDAMRKIMGYMHKARLLLDPNTEEGKVVEAAYHKLSKHFAPDLSDLHGQQPQLAQQGGQPQPGPGGMPPMAGGPGQMPQTRGPIPLRQPAGAPA